MRANNSPIENGRVDGNKGTFGVTTREWRFLYNPTLKENFLSGELTLESTNGKTSRKSGTDPHEGELTSRPIVS